MVKPQMDSNGLLMTFSKHHLHLQRSDVLVIVLQHVGEERGVVGHAVAPLHMHRLACEGSVAHARVHHEQTDAEAQQDLHGSRCLSPEDSGGSQSHQMSSRNLNTSTVALTLFICSSTPFH